jgi:protein-S-isoprenylcysteine O-methyltransferase Ste14
MSGILTALYSAICYVIFFLTFLYAIGFVENAVVPKTIDSGTPGPLIPSLLINAVLLSVFAVQHSLMARPKFKAAWTRIVPQPAERSTYVLFTSLALILLFWFWQPMPQTMWEIQGGLAQFLFVLSLLGWATVLVSTFLISHFHLFGLHQGFARMMGYDPSGGPFVTPLFYKYIRHPIYAGFIIAFWSAPVMSLGHLVFAVATTGYILIGIWFEERDLTTHFGERYTLYRKDVGMLVPKVGRGGRGHSPKVE